MAGEPAGCSDRAAKTCTSVARSAGRRRRARLGSPRGARPIHLRRLALDGLAAYCGCLEIGWCRVQYERRWRSAATRPGPPRRSHLAQHLASYATPGTCRARAQLERSVAIVDAGLGPDTSVASGAAALASCCATWGLGRCQGDAESAVAMSEAPVPGHPTVAAGAQPRRVCGIWVSVGARVRCSGRCEQRAGLRPDHRTCPLGGTSACAQELGDLQCQGRSSSGRFRSAATLGPPTRFGHRPRQPRRVLQDPSSHLRRDNVTL